MNELMLWQADPYLEPFRKTIWQRHEQAVIKEHELTNGQGKLSVAANAHLFYGLHQCDNGWVLREWAPNASAIYLIGDFNDWRKDPFYALRSIGNGNWEIILPQKSLHHGDLYKLWIEWPGGCGERIPAYTKRAVQDVQTKLFSAQVWVPPKPYKWKYAALPRVKYPLIYEAHIGMSSEAERVSTFDEFRTNVLPRIATLGYNTIQLMAIQEHPYYGSFGYQVSNFFAVSSRFGTPEELKHLIDEAHKHGIAVVLDIIHSHAVKNELEGLSRFDGTEDLYFHQGERGTHPVWNSRCFNYGRSEVINFLLSNCKYWLEEYRFDGFRFDGVTSMIYYDHGIGRDFTEYKFYYDGNQDEDAIYLLNACHRACSRINPNAITIAEDVSGMPGLATPQADGGVGFDFRMSMGVADFWIKTIKEKKDEQWHVGDMFYELTNKRADERHHKLRRKPRPGDGRRQNNQFPANDKEMYSSMDVFHSNLIIDRGIALHKLIRLVTLATAAATAILILWATNSDIPSGLIFRAKETVGLITRARRQWHLADDTNLRYRFPPCIRLGHDWLSGQRIVFCLSTASLVQHTNRSNFNL